MAVDAEVLEWIREAVASADSWESVRSSLQSHDPEGDDERLRPFLFAFGYAFHAGATVARERAGGPFGVMVAGDGWRFPPPVDDVDDSDVAAWSDALAAVSHSVAQARLGDLLWERKHRPDPHLAARAACDALLEEAFADAGWHAYLLNLLADPLGLNLRNSISHGLHGTVGAIDASLLVQAALLLAGMSLKSLDDPPVPPSGASSTG